MAFYIVCHNGAQYSLERGHKYLNSFQILYNVGRTVKRNRYKYYSTEILAPVNAYLK